MPIIFIFIIALIFCFSHIRGQRAEERKAEEEFLRNEEIRHKTECEIEKSKVKMQNHPLLEAVGSCLIGTINSYLNKAASIAISPTVSGRRSDEIFIEFFAWEVGIKSDGYSYTDYIDRTVKFSDFGYDRFESEYDLQVFGEYLYSKLRTYYAQNSDLTWKFRFEGTGRACSGHITIDCTECHPKLKSI